MRFYRSGARVGSRTGLVLVPAGGEGEFRVASSSYGALNPPVRGPVGSDVLSWSRHDTYGGRTVYTASTRGCAFDEVLAGFRRRLGTRDSLVKDAAAVGLTVAEFVAAMEEDWANLGVLYPGHVPAAWRTGRLMFTVSLPVPPVQQGQVQVRDPQPGEPVPELRPDRRDRFRCVQRHPPARHRQGHGEHQPARPPRRRDMTRV